MVGAWLALPALRPGRGDARALARTWAAAAELDANASAAAAIDSSAGALACDLICKAFVMSSKASAALAFSPLSNVLPEI